MFGRIAHRAPLGVAALLAAVIMVAVLTTGALAQTRFLGQTRLAHREADLDVLAFPACVNLVAVKLKALRGAAEINLLVVTYGNGAVDRLPVRHRIREGGETRWIDLRGGRRCVRSIAVVGDTERSRDQTIIQFWGR